MAEVVLTIAGRPHRLACRDGEEEQLRAAGRIVDARVSALGEALGAVPEARLMLMAALSIAGDQLAGPQPPALPGGPDLAALADRIEALASLLERAAARA